MAMTVASSSHLHPPKKSHGTAARKGGGSGGAGSVDQHMQNQLTRSLERLLEEAQLSGELKLSGRKLKDFPKIGRTGQAPKYCLLDTVYADLSKNRFLEMPEEVTEFQFLEKLHLYHNAIRAIPETVASLQSLTYLDLSRNQLTALPREICRLPLEILLVASNRLISLPEELGRMASLTELDASCNEITSLPARIGELPKLRILDLRCNLLVQMSIELTYLKLVKLDISQNRISVLPNELRKMKTLVDLELSDNPLTSPPAALCIRGRIHIFKYLERQAVKNERARSGKTKKGLLDAPTTGRSNVAAGARSHKRHNVDSGYSTSDGLDKRWSQEFNTAASENEARSSWRRDCSPLLLTMLNDIPLNGSRSGTSTPSTISPGENTSFEDLGKALQNKPEGRGLERSASDNGGGLLKPVATKLYQTSVTPPGNLQNTTLETTRHNNLTQPVQPMLTSANSLPRMNGEEKISLNHIQTYREYKEALRQQRAQDGASVYRPKEQSTPPGNEVAPSDIILETNGANLVTGAKQIFNEDGNLKRPVQKVPPSRINYQNSNTTNGTSNELNGKNGIASEELYKKPSSPIKIGSTVLSIAPPKIITAPVNFVEGTKSPIKNGTSPWSGSNSSSEKYSFTMRREFERAKEEADLIDQLKTNIESRLKMSLPDDLATALMDGVVLCHLANHVRPRSVASIHVPSPAVPKLTMARCRRNVDNFLDACRKIGVDEEVLLDTEAIMDIGYMQAYGLKILSQLVSSLLQPKRPDADVKEEAQKEEEEEKASCDLPCENSVLTDGNCISPDESSALPVENCDSLVKSACDLPAESFDLPDGSFDSIDVSPTADDQYLSGIFLFVLATTFTLLYLFPVPDK